MEPSTIEILLSTVDLQLRGRRDFSHYSERLKGALDNIDPTYWDILTGLSAPRYTETRTPVSPDMAKVLIAIKYSTDGMIISPDNVTVDKANAFIKENYTDPNTEYVIWSVANENICRCLLATVGSHIKFQLIHLKTATEMWTGLTKLYGSVPAFTCAEKYNNLMACVYTQGVHDSVFVRNWRTAFNDVQDILPSDQKIPDSLIRTMFINAVSKNPGCMWRDHTIKFRADDKNILDRLISEFTFYERTGRVTRG